MQVKLRQIGNSLGVTIPANALKTISAGIGDIVEIQIKRVITKTRTGWDDPALWFGAQEDEALLQESKNGFDREDWQW